VRGSRLALLVIGLGGCPAAKVHHGSALDDDAGALTTAPDAELVPPDDAVVRCTGRGPQPVDAVWSLTIAGTPRSARIHVAPSYDPTRPTPVILDFHGYALSAAQQEEMSGLNPKADREGFIAVHPEGTGALKGWNAGACCGTAALAGVDDLGFVDELLVELDAVLCVDPKRIYATGFSNGGFLAHRLACERAQVFAAVAAVAGVMGMPSCAPTRPVPVLQIHGTGDVVVPYLGGPSFPSVASTVDGWTGRDGCVGSAVEIFHQDDARCATHARCDAGAEVTLCTIAGGGHTWPGGGPFVVGGYQSHNLNATDTIWDFFAAHPLP